MAKLTKTQETVLNEMKAVIETVKKYNTFTEYFENEIKPTYYENWEFSEYSMMAFKTRYENAKNNIVIKKANTKTFEKLASLGLIEVIEYKENQQDLIRVVY